MIDLEASVLMIFALKGFIAADITGDAIVLSHSEISASGEQHERRLFAQML